MRNRKKRRLGRRLAYLLTAALILSAGTGSSVFAETEQTEPGSQQEIQDLQEPETETELPGETETEMETEPETEPVKETESSTVPETVSGGETPGGSEPETAPDTETEPEPPNEPPVQVQSVFPAQNQILASPAGTVDSTDEAVQSVQDQINTLPSDIELASMSLEEQQTVYKQVQTAYDAYNALTDEQKEQITGAEIFNELFAVFNGIVNALATAGDFTVNGGSSSDYSYSNGVLTINTSTPLTISTSSQTTDRIAIASGVNANLTLNGVNINAPAQTNAIDVSSGASLTLTLANNSMNTLSVTSLSAAPGRMTIAAGIHVPENASLTIQCAFASGGNHQCDDRCGKLSVTGADGYTNGYGGVGVGGNGVNIDGGENSGTIHILGGQVTITGGSSAYSGAGIGGGAGGQAGGNCGQVYITGGQVIITGGLSNGTGTAYGGAGIGGGNSAGSNGGDGGTVVITGGNVKVTGGSGGSSNRSRGGAGIGGGIGNVSSSNCTGGDGGTVIILTEVSITGGQGNSVGTDIGGGQGYTAGDSGSGIRPGSNGNYTVYGNLTLPESITIPNGVTVTIPSGTSLTNPSNMTLTINGTLSVVGTLTNNGTITGSGKITPNTAKFSASITGISVSKTAYNGTPVQDSEVKYTYTGDSSASITLEWYRDNNGTMGSSLSSAPSNPGTYWVQVSAASTGFYRAVSENYRFTIAKGQPSQPAAPTVSSQNANSITINTISGQNYMYTTTATPPGTNDRGWVTATGTTLTFDKLSSNTPIYIWTYAPENDDYYSSSVSSALSASTSEPTYTVTIPSDPSESMIAGNTSSTAKISVDSQTFNIGYGGVVSVSADKSVTLARTGDQNTTITSALLVDNTEHTGGVFISFNQDNYLTENKTIRFDQPALAGGGTIPAGFYTGTMTFTISYSEGSSNGQ